MLLKDLLEQEDDSEYADTLHNIHKKELYLQGPRAKVDETGTMRIPAYIKSHILGLILIKELKRVVLYGGAKWGEHRPEGELRSEAAIAILNKHLKGDRDVHACQEELLEAGLGEYAKL